MDDLEEDKEYRQNVNIYKNTSTMPVDVNNVNDPDFPQITLEEMMDDLVIGDDSDGDDVEMQ